MNQKITIKPNPLLFLIILFAYPFLIFKSIEVNASKEFNLFIFGSLTLFFLVTIWWNFVSFTTTQDSVSLQRGVLFNSAAKTMQLNDLRDVGFVFTRVYPLGSDLTLSALAMSLKDTRLNIFSVKNGLFESVDGKSIAIPLILNFFKEVLSKRTLNTRKAWFLKDNTWYQLVYDDRSFHVEDAQSNPIHEWKSIDIKSLANNQFDLYKQGNLIMANINETLSVKILLENINKPVVLNS